jgi:type IV secretory pathway VirB2 component (pilin)
VTDTAEVLLAVIAVSVLLMALVQVGLIVAGLRVARRVDRIATEIETGVKPLIANLTTISADAARAAALAAAQVERFDRLFADMTAKVEHTLAAAQHFVTGPAQSGLAIVAGIRAAVGAIQGMREATRRRSAARAVTFEEEEESLFIG